MKVSTVEQMRELDRRAIQDFGIPETVLMENAGLACYRVIQEETEVSGRAFVVFCGVGNNGGDGLVVARKLHSNKGRVTAVVMGDPESYSGASRDNCERAERAGVKLVLRPSHEEMQALVGEADVLVDALLGTGLTRDVGGAYKDAVEILNASGLPVFSADIPSGVDGDTGQIRGVAVQARHTVTFGLPKLGNLLYPGASRGGRLWVTHISFPPKLYEDKGIRVEVSRPRPLKDRPEDGHKGSFGDVLFVAGAAGYFGAPSFSSLSFLKAGGGYSRLAAPKSVVPHVAGVAGEVVFLPQEETPEGTLSSKSLPSLLEWSGKVDMVVAGPGLSLHEETQGVLRELVARAGVPVLLDGDGLTAVSSHLELVKERKAPTLMTPHPGEMARLCGVNTAEVKQNAVSLLQKTCAELGAHVVVKGAHSLVGHPDGRVTINVSGNSGMASAGSGDVLTGTVAAMYGLGLSIPEALLNGVFLHGMAGDLAALHRGRDGLTARDIMEWLPQTVESFREDYEAILTDHYGTIRML